MKKVGCFLLLLFCITSTQSQSNEDFDNAKGTSMLPILVDADTVLRIFESANYTIERMEFDDILKNTSFYYQFPESMEYGIFVFGDYKIGSISLKVFREDTDGNLVFLGNGNQDGRTASIFIKVDKTLKYKFEVSVDRYNRDFQKAHYGFIFFHY